MASPQRPVYTPYFPAEGGAMSRDLATRVIADEAADPWDGRPSREEAFVARIKARAPQATIADLDPILDRLRLIKSPREIAAIREATRISCAGILEAMKTARPGLKERDLEAVADYVFRKNGAQGAAYFALAATGRNAHYPHYHGGDTVLEDGDLVLFDYAPDVHNYSSDVTRMFPTIRIPYQSPTSTFLGPGGASAMWPRPATFHARSVLILFSRASRPHIPLPRRSE